MRSLVAIRALEPACGSAGRCRACAATTRSRGCTSCLRYPRCAVMRRRLPALARAPLGAGRMRRGDGPPAARHARARAKRSTARAGSSTCGRSTTPRRSAGSRRWASTRSSPTTRGCFEATRSAGRGAEVRGVRAGRGLVADLGDARAAHDLPSRASSGSHDAAQDARAVAGDLEAPARLARRAGLRASPSRAAHPAPAAVGAVAVLDAEAQRRVAAPPGMRRGCRSRPGAPRVSQTLTVAHSLRLAACAGTALDGEHEQGDEERSRHT